jgi:hypothetical protein
MKSECNYYFVRIRSGGKITGSLILSRSLLENIRKKRDKMRSAPERDTKKEDKKPND